jgi:hypothetical protein
MKPMYVYPQFLSVNVKHDYAEINAYGGNYGKFVTDSTVTITMNMYDYRALMQTLENDNKYKSIRESCPAVMNAYEHYMTVMALAAPNDGEAEQ